MAESIFWGYDEVVELNQELIDQELEDVKREVVADIKRYFNVCGLWSCMCCGCDIVNKKY